ncbi:MAG: uL30 family ribosomal protein [Thermoplasmata archaeon]|nr:uL30 family ribosomal protein [Thermoplasmata archaeon]
MAWIVVRVRGGIHSRRDIRQALDELHLTRPNHATVIPEEPSFRGTLMATQGYVTWGEAEAETVSALLAARGQTRAGARLSAPTAGTPPLANLVTAVLGNGLARVKTLKPLVRLTPPKGGWKSTKKPFSLGGALGYRGRAINDLVRRML